MHRVIIAMKMLFQVMDLGMAIMAGSDRVSGACTHYLVEFDFAIVPACVRKPGLEKSAAAAAAVIIGHIGSHVDEVLFADDLFDHIAKV